MISSTLFAINYKDKFKKMKMKVTALVIIILLSIHQNANAQFGKKLKEAITGNTTTTNENSGSVEEEKVKNVGKSFTISTKFGDVKYDIDISAVMIAENKSADATTQHFLTTTKKQYVFHSITVDKNNATTKMEKTIVNKNQVAYCANTNKLNDNSYEVKIYLLSQANMKRINAGETESNPSENQLVLYTNTIEKANSLLSTILGKEVNGSILNTFVYTTGDGNIVKTSAKAFWSLRDGILYFESLASEKALRVTYFEINTDANSNSTYLVKVTVIPYDAIGEYKNFSFEGKDAYLPLKKSITKVIYDKQEASTNEIINDRFRLAANNFGSVLTNEYCTIVSQQLSSDQKAKFKKEIQEPIVAKRLAEEKEAERLYQESKNNNSNSSSSSSSSSSKSSTTKTEAKEIRIEMQNTSSETIYLKFEGGTYGSSYINKGTVVSYNLKPGGKILNKKTVAVYISYSENLKPNSRIKIQ